MKNNSICLSMLLSSQKMANFHSQHKYLEEIWMETTILFAGIQNLYLNNRRFLNLLICMMMVLSKIKKKFNYMKKIENKKDYNGTKIKSKPNNLKNMIKVDQNNRKRINSSKFNTLRRTNLKGLSLSMR